MGAGLRRRGPGAGAIAVSPLLVYLGSVAVFWCVALLVALRTRRSGRWRVASDGPGPADSTPRLAVVIPARNEVANIGACVDAVLAMDWPELHCFVLDDGSTDGTAEVLAVAGARHPGRLTVVPGGAGPLPPGWYGKPWACQRAAEAALASAFAPQWLLFLDADVRVAPGAARAALGYASREGLALLSGFGRLVMESAGEKLMQPVIAGMIISGNPLSRTNDPAKRRGPPIANGQFLLFRAEAWAEIGGHGAVRQNVLDDVGLATAVVGAGLRYHMVFMQGLFSCRMYDSFGALWAGWTKNLFPGLGRSWPALLAVVAFTLVGTVLPPLILLFSPLLSLGPAELAAAALATLAIHGLRLYLDRTFQQPLAWAFTHVPASALLVVLLCWSALRTSRGQATWKGRTLGATP